MRIINWGIIGCGDVTEVKSGPAFRKISGSRLIAVMRRNAARAADYARRHDVGKWYNNSDDILSDPEIHAIYIATPPASHAGYAIAALEKGLYVYVEKPVTMNAVEAKAIAEVVRKTGGLLTVAHYRRALPMFLKVKELLDTKAIGDVRTVEIRMWQSSQPAMIADSETNWRIQPELSGGGYFHDLAPHQIDLMLFYFGEPLKYHGFALNQSRLNNADDHVSGQICFRNNIIVNGSWCFNVSESEIADSCEIIGSEGKITFPFFGHTLHWHNMAGSFSHEFERPPHVQQPMLEKVIAYFNGQGPNPASIDEAITLMEIMDCFVKKS